MASTLERPVQTGELVAIDTAIKRAREATKAFGKEIASLPEVHMPPIGKARRAFQHFDVDGSGAIGADEVLSGVRALGIDVECEVVREMFDEIDVDGSGQIELKEFASLVERVTALQQGKAWPVDAERLAATVRVLHAQAMADPLSLVAEGEVPTLLRCATSGHAAVEQLGLGALAAVAEAPHAQCSQAIASRPALRDVLRALARPSVPLPSVRQGVRLLAALCRDASEAKEVRTRCKLRLQLCAPELEPCKAGLPVSPLLFWELAGQETCGVVEWCGVYDSLSPLLTGAFGQRCAADEAQAGTSMALLLQALASEAEIAPRLGADGGGRALHLACQLARSSSAAARAASVEVICYCAAVESNRCRLIGQGALQPLLAAAATPSSSAHDDNHSTADAARRALDLLRYEELWKGVRGADPVSWLRY